MLAVGSDTGEIAQRAEADGDTLAALSGQNRDQRFSSVTVALAPKQVQDLVLAQEVGDLSFSLRSFREGDAPLDIPRSNPSGSFGIADTELVPRRAPSWQEIRGNVR